MMPVIKKLEARYRDRGVVFLAVHTADTDIADVQNFLEQIPFNLLTAIDSGEAETAKRHGGKGTPALVVIGRDGRIAWNSRQVSKEDGMQSLERAARSFSVPGPSTRINPRTSCSSRSVSSRGLSSARRSNAHSRIPDQTSDQVVPSARSRSAKRSATVSNPGKTMNRFSDLSHLFTFFSAAITVV